MGDQHFAKEILREVCAAGGSLKVSELTVRPTSVALLLQDRRRFTLVTREDPPSAAGGGEHRVVVATTGARLCREHGGGKCAGSCRQLHLCRYFVYGECRQQVARKPCKFIHDIYSPHNLSILEEHGLEVLNSNELCQLLLQNDPSLLPEICPYYNKGEGPYGSCTFKKICVKLHICQYYLQGECRFGSNCRHSHDIFNPDCYEKLEKWGMSPALINRVPLIYRNVYDIKNNTSSTYKEHVHPLERRESTVQVSPTTDESEMICLYHIRKSCSFQDKCIRLHFHLPYRWEMLDGNSWKEISGMEKIERGFCDPFNERILYNRNNVFLLQEYIDFSTMTCGSAKVRRLSTASSVTKSPHYILTTDWTWYWKDEYDVWNEYGVQHQSDDHAAASVSSFDLEKAYQSDPCSTLFFSAGKHNYEIDFKAMKQKNRKYLTERSVRRRPKFVSLKEVEKRKNSGAEQSKGSSTNVPAHWDQTALPDLGYVVGSLDCAKAVTVLEETTNF